MHHERGASKEGTKTQYVAFRNSKVIYDRIKQQPSVQPGVFIVNFEHISHLVLSVSIVNFEHVNADWEWNKLSVAYVYYAAEVNNAAWIMVSILQDKNEPQNSYKMINPYHWRSHWIMITVSICKQNQQVLATKIETVYCQCPVRGHTYLSKPAVESCRFF